MTTTPNPPKKRVQRHKPKDTLAFLKLFDTSKGIKFLTHSWNDKEFDREAIVATAKKEFEAAKKIYSIPDAILSRFENFAFKEKPEWFFYKNGKKQPYTLGWSSKEVIDWCNAPMSKGKSPYADPDFFDDMIEPFKHSIEIRLDDLPQILHVLKKQLKQQDDKFNITINVENAQFYTNVDEFERGLQCLFNTFSQKAKENNCYDIDISYEKKWDDNLCVIIITHKGSLPKKHSEDNTLIKGDLAEVRKHFTGLCDWSIEAKFLDGLKRIIILEDGNFKTPEVKEIKKEEIGFTHILTFYA